MKRPPLGSGLASLIREVPNLDTLPLSPPSSSAPLSWPVEHPSALTPPALRLSARAALEKLSARPHHGVKAARAYLDKLRQVDGRTHVSLDLSGVDLTTCTMLSLRRGRIIDSTRYHFFGVSIWLR